MKDTKRSFLTSCISLLLCFIMLLGTTFAWFTDVSVSANNVIQAGNLDIELQWSKDGNIWHNAGGIGDQPIFNYDKWEPGYTEVRYVKIKNEGSLAFKYQMLINPNGPVGTLAEVIDVSYDIVTDNADFVAPTAANKQGSLDKVGKLNNLINANGTVAGGVLLPDGVTKEGYYTNEIVLCLSLHMDEYAGNEYQNLSIGGTFGIKLVATQFDYENDSFDNSYDSGATWPDTFVGNSASSTVTLNSDNTLASQVTMTSPDGKISATLPAGTMMEQGTTSAILNVYEVENSGANITLNEDEASRSIDVHVNGVAEGNTTVMAITVKELLPTGLNMGNHRFYHVEGGNTVEMTLLPVGQTPVHNNYEYDPATGDVVLHLASFSEVAVVAEPPKWEGNRDYSWYTNAVAPLDGEATADYVIANADQLAALSAIVGGMDGQTKDSFAGKTVKLISDINLGDEESDNNPDIIFYPIGYYNSDGTYEKTGTAITSGLRNFEGTFDGNGHTISNFYHNTWEMKGDHDWYDATLQYYRDGMGLFGRVYKGTVKNLTVKNFSSDGEIATTGVIAAYADGATFENIAIFDCNPRVYNIGNGGIVGCVGWYAKEAGLQTTFTNITVDNSNKISALWGSYDVACGGIVGQYYPTSGQSSAEYPVNAGIHFENCHVSAVMDVYNDVCANYQYYAYRYTGMLIGSVRENVTIDGHVYPKMDGITAEECTVHFGDWNDYYYCEIIDNTTASYTHDYQMSRLVQVKAVNGTTITPLEGESFTVPSSGRYNYVVVNGDHATGNATCYHFKDGKVWNHTDGGYHNGQNGEKFIDENGDGIGDLKEDKQHIYLEFNNLVTGYGWGVTSKGVGDLAGVTILDREVGNSVVKFEGKVTELANNKTYKLGDIFSFVDNGVKLVPGALTVSVTYLDEKNPVSATIVYDRENWANSTITFIGEGDIQITIQDYYFCTPTTIEVNVTDRQPEVKFDVVMNNGDFLHRVGNSGTVALDKLFKAKDGVSVGTVSVTVTPVSGDGVSGSYSNNAIQFSGTGVVKVTITDNDYCIPTELYLEVVDATNVTGLSGTISGNVVLLDNCGLSSLTVNGRNAVYGNGFTATYSGDGQYLNNGLKQGVVTVSENGTLDNLRIVASIYPTAYMYSDEVKGGPSSVEGDKTRYHYQLSAVAASGNAIISNCYIYGARNNIFVNTGDVTIKDTVLECGTLANIQIQSNSSHTITLENVTTIQHQVNATIGDTSAVMLGAGVVVGPDIETNPTIVLNGSFKQYNWVTADDKASITNSTAQTIIQTALDATEFNHTVNGKTASNLGIIYLNDAGAEVTNNTGLPYKFGVVSMMGENGKVYSLQNATTGQIYSDYENADRSTVNGDYLPTFEFDLGDQEISYDGSEDTRYLYGDANGITALYQDGESYLTLDLTKLATIYKYQRIPYNVTTVCKDSGGNALAQTNGVVTLSAQGSYTLVFTVNDNIFYDKNGEAITKSVERTFTVPLELTVKEADIKNAVVNVTKTALDGVYTTVNLTDYKLRINFLDCISVTDYDNTGTGTTVNLSSNISSATLTPSSVNVFTTASTATITYTDGRVLTVNFSKISGSSAGTKTATLNTSGGLYFITDGALNNKPTEESSQNVCTITSVSYKGNSGSVVTNDTDVTVTWELGSSGGTNPCVTPDTLVTLADGTQKRIDQVTYEDKLLVWNHFTGKYDVAPAAIIFNHGYSDNTIIKLSFSDGTIVKVANLHQFYDNDLNKFVTIDADSVAQYVGHSFAKHSGDGYTTVTLDSYEISVEYEAAYGIISAFHYNIIVEGMISTDFMLEDYDLFNYFELGEGMTFDKEQMQADIEKYGLYTYEDFADYLTYDQFVAFNVQYFKIAVGKGNYTYEGIIELINTYLNN